LIRHIAVIDPAVKTAETDCFNRLVLESPLPLTYHLPKLGGMDSLVATQAGMAGIVVLGSGSSVNDGEPWQLAMNQWLLPMLQKGIPTIGLCYGHQLIAHLFGAKVDFVFADHKKHLGFRSLSLKANRLWGDRAITGSLVVSHREMVVDCPEGFEIVGSSPEIKVDALAHKTLPIWSFQSHPESTASFLNSQGIAQPQQANPFNFGHGIMGDFLKFVASRG
jgi:GMP synthase-like glutamine amidotransferase